MKIISKMKARNGIYSYLCSFIRPPLPGSAPVATTGLILIFGRYTQAHNNTRSIALLQPAALYL